MEMKLIGHVAVDSGQLLLCDPCYIDSQWMDDPFQDIRKYQHKETKKTLQYQVDFQKYNEIIPEYGIDMNALNNTGEWEELKNIRTIKYPFSYNACCDKTLQEPFHGPLKFNMGHEGAGVAFATAIGDGYYPVYAIYDDNDNLLEVKVNFVDNEDFQAVNLNNLMGVNEF